MKLTFITSVTVISIATGVLIIGNTYSPSSGQGALEIFKNKVKIHQVLEMDSTWSAYTKLGNNMGLIVGRYSKVIYPSDNFCICKDSIGYYPTVLRNGKFLVGLTKVYLPIREGIIFVEPAKKNFSGLIETVKSLLDKPVPVATSFPKTLRYGAGWGEFSNAAPYVRLLQEKLVQKGISITVNGRYDQVMVNAVYSFQRNNHLYRDGIAGDETIKALGL